MPPLSHVDLFRFPHWFDKILCSRVWFISLTRFWFVLSRRWILTRLLFFGFCWHELPLRDGVQRQITVTIPWPMDGVQFVAKTYRSGFQKNDQGEDGDSRKKWYFLSKVFVTNLQFDQVRFFWVTEVSNFWCCFVATQPSIWNAHRWCEGKPRSAWLEDTPAMDLELKGIRTHM